MAEKYQRPTNNNNLPIPFTIEADGQTFTGTLTASGKAVAFGRPNAFIMRLPGQAPKTISIYMGKWVLQASDDFVTQLGVWIENHYK